MDIRKSFFGGYKRNDVDRLVSRLTDVGNVAEARIKILEKEIEDLRQSSKTDLGLISQDAEAGRRRINDLKAQLDTLDRQAGDLRRQVEKRDSRIMELEEKCRQADRSAEIYDAKIRQIGEIYAEALEYSRRLKEDTKKDIAEIVNTFFDEMLKSGKGVRTNPEETDYYRGPLNDIAQELEETSVFLKSRINELNSGAGRRPSTPDLMTSARDRLTDKIRNDLAQGGPRDAAPDKDLLFNKGSASPRAGIDQDSGSFSRKSSDAAGPEDFIMPGQLEIKLNNEEEEDRHKYQQTFDEMRTVKQGDTLSDHEPEPSADRSTANSEDRYSDIREEASASVPKKTSIREILEKYSKF